MGEHTEKQVYLCMSEAGQKYIPGEECKSPEWGAQKLDRNTHPERKGMGILSNEEEHVKR